MNGRKRKVQIKFYVTEEERALIEQKMKLVPTQNMAAYLRKIAIDGYIIQTDHSDIKAMTAEIQKIGVNINQIAKRVNATGSVYQEDNPLPAVRAVFDAVRGGRKRNSALGTTLFILGLEKLCIQQLIKGKYSGLKPFA